MGAKQSRTGQSHATAWATEEETTEDGALFDVVVSLERSTLSDKARNTLGLPDDVIALIATYLNVRDLGRVARVCKTWRRISLKEAVWWDFAVRLRLEPKPGDNCRAMVVLTVVCQDPGFVRAPKTLQQVRGHCDGEEVRITVVSPDLPENQNAVGKSALVIRRIQNKFVEDYDPTIEDTYRQQVTVDGQLAMLDITDTAGQSEFAAMRYMWYRDCAALLICSLFDRRGTIDAVEAMYDACCRVKGAKVPVVLVRTKTDLKLPFAEPGRVMAWCDKVGAGFVNTSSKTGQNEMEPFLMAVRLVLGPRPKPKVRRTD